MVRLEMARKATLLKLLRTHFGEDGGRADFSKKYNRITGETNLKHKMKNKGYEFMPLNLGFLPSGDLDDWDSLMVRLNVSRKVLEDEGYFVRIRVD